MTPELAFSEYLKKHNGIIPVPTEESLNVKHRVFSPEFMSELKKIQELETYKRAMGYNN